MKIYCTELHLPNHLYVDSTAQEGSLKSRVRAQAILPRPQDQLDRHEAQKKHLEAWIVEGVHLLNSLPKVKKKGQAEKEMLDQQRLQVWIDNMPSKPWLDATFRLSTDGNLESQRNLLVLLLKSREPRVYPMIEAMLNAGASWWVPVKEKIGSYGQTSTCYAIAYLKPNEGERIMANGVYFHLPSERETRWFQEALDQWAVLHPGESLPLEATGMHLNRTPRDWNFKWHRMFWQAWDKSQPVSPLWLPAQKTMPNPMSPSLYKSMDAGKVVPDTDKQERVIEAYWAGHLPLERTLDQLYVRGASSQQAPSRLQACLRLLALSDEPSKKKFNDELCRAVLEALRVTLANDDKESEKHDKKEQKGLPAQSKEPLLLANQHAKALESGAFDLMILASKLKPKSPYRKAFLEWVEKRFDISYWGRQIALHASDPHTWLVQNARAHQIHHVDPNKTWDGHVNTSLDTMTSQEKMSLEEWEWRWCVGLLSNMASMPERQDKDITWRLRSHQQQMIKNGSAVWKYVLTKMQRMPSERRELLLSQMLTNIKPLFSSNSIFTHKLYERLFRGFLLGSQSQFSLWIPLAPNLMEDESFWKAYQLAGETVHAWGNRTSIRAEADKVWSSLNEARLKAAWSEVGEVAPALPPRPRF